MFPQTEKNQLAHYTWHLKQVCCYPPQLVAPLMRLSTFSPPTQTTPHANSGCRLERTADFTNWIRKYLSNS